MNDDTTLTHEQMAEAAAAYVKAHPPKGKAITTIRRVSKPPVALSGPKLADPEPLAPAAQEPLAPAGITREQWLMSGVEALRPGFEAAGFPLPEKLRVSVGWPGGRGKKKNVIGQCWPTSLSSDGTHAIFISPVVIDSVEALGTLAHELCHAAAPKAHQHRGPFVRIAKAIGLTAPWTATGVGPALKEYLTDLAVELGAYDHAALTSNARGQYVQGTRMIRVACSVCEYQLRTTRKWLEVGIPSCPNPECENEGIEMVPDAA